MYVVVCEGVTVIDCVVAPVFQVREVPPLTVRVAELPWQMVGLLLIVVVT